MRITWNELTVSPDGVDFGDLLSDWRWLVGEEYRPVVISALGDLFLRHDDGRIFWLNAGWGQLTEVAENADEFKKLMVQPNNSGEWFIPNLIGDLLASGKKLGPGECFSYKVPPVLGGDIDPDNFEPTSLSVHFSIMGQIHEQVKDLPEGTPIGEVKIREAKCPKKKRANQRMKLTGAAILVSRGMKVLQAAPAAYPYRSATGGDGMTEAEWWLDRYRAAATSVGRGNVLEEMALEADEAADTSLKEFILQAAEGSKDEADEHLRVRALEVFRWLGLPDEEYRRRVIDWVLGRIGRADRRSSERTYGVTACHRWIREARVQARLLGLVTDETEEGGLRLLALDCFTLLGPGEAPPELLDACHRLASVYLEETDDDALGRKARRVLARIGER